MQMARHRIMLNDKFIAQKLLQAGDYMDSLVPGFGLCITPQDHRNLRFASSYNGSCTILPGQDQHSWADLCLTPRAGVAT
jgi:hypothetical protein